MTLEQAKASERVAYCFLPSGAALRLDPEDGLIRELAFPERPTAWRQAQAYRGDAPVDGWRHLAGCTCSVCGGAVVAQSQERRSGE